MVLLAQEEECPARGLPHAILVIDETGFLNKTVDFRVYCAKTQHFRPLFAAYCAKSDL
jgi:hypothetical protein